MSVQMHFGGSDRGATSSLSSKAHGEKFIQRWNTPHRGANDPGRIQCVEQLVHFVGVSDNVSR